MHFSGSAAALTVSLLSFTTSVLAQTCPSGFRPSNRLKWVPCTGTESYNTGTYDCTSIDVPLDWANPLDSGNTLTIPLVRRRATGPGPYKTIVYNPGGPGSSGIESLLAGSIGTSLVGNNYHVLSFDPRGVGLTNPYKCPSQTDYSYDGYVQHAQYCDDNYGTPGQLVGTAYVARDIKAIIEALSDEDGDGYIRYYGYSYGTILGATTAAMFRDRIGGMVIDGNLNPYEYYTQSTVRQYQDDNLAVENFFKMCFAANERCKFRTAEITSAEDLLAKWTNWVGVADSNGNYVLPTGNPTSRQLNAGQSATVRDNMFNQLYGVDYWENFAAWLQYFYQDKTKITSLGGPGAEIQPPPSSTTTTTTGGTLRKRATATFSALSSPVSNPTNFPQALSAIRCGDSRWDRTGVAESGPNPNTFTSLLTQVLKLSKYLGDRAIGIQWTCATWVTKAKERYSGNFDDQSIKTFKPIIVAQTIYDPVTPLNGGEKMNTAFIDSALLVSNGAGHTTAAQRSKELDEAILAYWTAGTVPASKSDYQAFQPNPFIPQTNGGGQSAVLPFGPRVGLPASFLDGSAFRGSTKQRRQFTSTTTLAVTTTTSLAVDPSVPTTCTPFLTVTTTTTTTSASTSTTSSSTTETTGTTTTTSTETTGTTTTTSTETTGTTTTTSTETTSTSTSTATETTGTSTSTTTETTSTATTTESTTTNTSSSTSTEGTLTSTSSSTSTETTSTSTASTATSTGLSTSSSSTTTGTAGSTSSTTSVTTGTTSGSTSSASTTTGTTSSTSVSTSSSTSTGSVGTTSGATSTTTSSGTVKPTSTSTSATSNASSYTITWTSSGTGTVWPTGTKPTGYPTGPNGYPIWSDWESWKTTTTKARPPKPSDWDKDYDWAPVDGFYRVTKTLTTTWVETVTKCAPTVAKCPYVITQTSLYTTIADVPTKTVYVTDLVDVCPTGLTTKVVTVTATCNQGCVAKPTGCPDGYTTTQVWCDKCATPSAVIVTRVDPNWVPVTGVPVAPASTWSAVAVPVTPVSTWVATPVKPAETWSAVATPVKPAETWGSNGVKSYTGGATSVTVSLGSLAIAMIAGVLVL